VLAAVPSDARAPAPQPAHARLAWSARFVCLWMSPRDRGVGLVECSRQKKAALPPGIRPPVPRVPPDVAVRYLVMGTETEVQLIRTHLVGCMDV